LIADGTVAGADEQDTWYLRKLDSGLFTLQTVDYILGWICMEDDGVRHMPCLLPTLLINDNPQIRDHVTMILGRKNKTLKDVVAVLKLYRDNVGEDETRIPPEKAGEAAPSQRQILEGLIAFLEGL